MNPTVVVLVPVLVLGVVTLLAFAGCKPFDAADDPPAQPGPATKPPGTPTTPGTGTAQVTTYAQTILQETGLRSYWRLGDPAASSAAVDSEPTMPKPGAYLGSVIRGEPGALTPTSGAGDKAARFEGAGYVQVDHDSLLNPPMAFSVEAWVQPALTQADTVTVVDSTDAGAKTGFVLEVKRNNAGVDSAVAQVGDGAAFNKLSVDLGPGTAHDGWHYVVMAYDKPTKVLSLLVHDGATLSSQNLPGIDFTPAAAGAFRIGAGRDNGDDPKAFFVGRLDEVALYDRSLNATVALAHVTAGLKT